ncbi:MAG: hypothetical protein ABSH47_21870 [Bryobacteraceae bacterium]|jgi:hypothetical protein
MSQHEKPLERFRGRPSDFTWDELTRLLAGFGYKELRVPDLVGGLPARMA